MAYCVPAVMGGGEANVAVEYPPPPLQKPVTVAVARSAPVGRLPDALRSETVTFGMETAAQLRLKKLTSTATTGPDSAAVNVCASQVVLVKPAPTVSSVVF